jgi:hypothetical protein
VGLGEAFLVDLDPVPVMGISTPRGRGSARQGTGGSTSAMWMPVPSVRSLHLLLDQDITPLMHACNNYDMCTVRFGKDKYYKLEEIRIHFKETSDQISTICIIR